jgi:type VI secretion system protein ImpB
VKGHYQAAVTDPFSNLVLILDSRTRLADNLTVHQETLMARESVHAKLERVRPPRVHVTYNVEIGDAIELKEIPFVMGVLADLSGQPEEPLPKIKDRRFVEITPDNFDSVLESMKPRVAFSVENKLSDDPNAGNLGVDLTFKSLEDFEPEQVARKVKPLREMLELRTKLSDLVGTLQGNEKLERLLQGVITDTDKLERVRGEMSKEAPKEGGSNG